LKALGVAGLIMNGIFHYELLHLKEILFTPFEEGDARVFILGCTALPVPLETFQSNKIPV